MLFNTKVFRQPPPLVSWLLLIIWTLLVCYLLVWPSEGTTVGHVSGFFGGTEITDAIGHVVLQLVEGILLHNLLLHYYSTQNAFRYAVICTTVLAVTLEFAQIWIPSRGASLLDLGANLFGVGLYVYTYRFYNSQSEIDAPPSS